MISTKRIAMQHHQKLIRSVGGSNPSLVRSSQQTRTFYGPLYKLAKKMLPRMSNTEKAALDSGTIGFDRNIFEGNPTLSMLDKYSVKLSPEEQKFIDVETTALCEMVDDYKVVNDKDLPVEVWKYISEKGFFGMIIPKKYGGLQMSAHGHSQVITKLSSRSAGLGVTVCVPNSLGPAELLLRYGTDAQKDEYLPALAKGKHIPCFGLTGPTSGSDAANMRDKGVVCKENGVLGIRCSFNKRYITLAPVATCVGLAIDVSDPEKLLGGVGYAGITVALLKRDHKGLEMGKRHNPLSNPFMNGPVTGKDVFIPMDMIIGGQTRVGFGWNMLMDCLAEGRCISLPAGAVAGAKIALNAGGAYARVRKQFKVPIATLEGVQEHLARIGGNTFTMVAGQLLVNGMLNQHEQPAVISGVVKQQLTKRGRECITEAMDVMGGSAICDGPNNFLAGKWVSAPVAITVEGANTLTRSMMIYGQGLTRAHPHLYSLIKTIQDGNNIKGFRSEVNKVVVHALTNTSRSVSRAVFRSRGKSDLLSHYESQMGRLSSNLAIAADLSLVMGGKLKFAEMISGRFADVFSNIYLGYACLWFYKNNRNVKGIDEFFDYAMTNLCYETQTAVFDISKNFPVGGVGFLIKALTFPLGACYDRPRDVDTKKIADLVSTNSEIRNLLSEMAFISSNPKDRVAMLNKALSMAVKADIILGKLKKEKRSATDAEKKLIDETESLREEIIQVDSFNGLGIEDHAPKGYVRPAMRK